MKRFLFFITACLILSRSSFAQSKDFGLWFSAGASVPITGYLDLKLEGDLRTYKDASKIHEKFAEAEMSLKVFTFLSAGVGYRLTSRIEDDNNYYLRHKFLADLKGKTNIRRVGLSCRLRYEYQKKTYINSENDLTPDNYLRVKLEASYNIRRSKIEPVIYYEPFYRIFESTSRPLEKYRLSAGLAYKLTRKQKISLSYIYQRDWVPNFIDTNIIALDYDFKL
ncbi:MAG TPA: DUF2490 domain-containing protein [Bacteroidales bacterium]|nr:DUF2490 domain-containing protein [Bacteroidales bacterium]